MAPNSDYPVYCTNPGHGDGEHGRSCMPLDPDDIELRMLRVIFGLCPYCERADEHEHPCRACGREQPLPDGSYCYHEDKDPT